MKADFHLHSSFSTDSKTPMEEMVKRGIGLGLKTMCFTEHMDFDFPMNELDFQLDTKSYQTELFGLKEKYCSQIELLFGVELGLQTHLSERLKEYTAAYPFDFVIGSSHVVDGMDPYFPEFFHGRKEEEAYRAYFQSIIDNVKAYSGMDIYGHIDYIVRYGPTKNKNYSYEQYRDILDQILEILIDKGVGIELNTAGFKYQLGQPHPHPKLIKRYRELGGEIITIGSDAHSAEHIAYKFQRAKEILENFGFHYYAEYRNRRPEFVKL